MAKTAAPALMLSLQFSDASLRHALPRHKIARWIRSALEKPAQMTVRVVGAEEGQSLNAGYRSKAYATNVLTFGYSTDPVVCADLVLCAPVLQAEAREAGISLDAHCAHLVIHGTLHAQGYDHVRASLAKVMERRETELMLKLGYDDPYAR